MKTKEQIKSEVVNYLTKTSQHTFIKPKLKLEYDSVKKESYYEPDYEDYTYFKVMKVGEDFMLLENNKLRKIEFESRLHDPNTKNLIKHRLFLNKYMKSVRNNKYVKKEIKEILGEEVAHICI